MAYSYDSTFTLNETRNRLRLLIADIKDSEGNYKFENEELERFLTDYVNIHEAAYHAILSMVADKAYLSIRFNMSRHLIDESMIPTNLLKVADRFLEIAKSDQFSIKIIPFKDEARAVADGEYDWTDVAYISDTVSGEDDD